MSGNNLAKNQKLELVGWGFFILCGILFLISGIKANDSLSIAASIVFLVGCVFFLIPYFKK